jgi:hypothetical protein
VEFGQRGIGVVHHQGQQAVALLGGQLGRGTAGMGLGGKRAGLAAALEQAADPGGADAEQVGDLLAGASALITVADDTFTEILRVGFHTWLEGRPLQTDANCCRPGVRTFLKLVPNRTVRQNSRFVASIRWPTDLDALGELAVAMPGRVYIHRGYFLPEEVNHDRSLMHSKTVYIENGQGDVHILVGSHNWTGQALDGNNLEASVHVRCPRGDLFADQVRTHIDRCVAESEVFDPSRLDDYKAIQVALHGWPDGPNEERFGFVISRV